MPPPGHTVRTYKPLKPTSGVDVVANDAAAAAKAKEAAENSYLMVGGQQDVAAPGTAASDRLHANSFKIS